MALTYGGKDPGPSKSKTPKPVAPELCFGCKQQEIRGKGSPKQGHTGLEGKGEDGSGDAGSWS